MLARMATALLGLAVAATGVAGLATVPPPRPVDRAAIATAIQAPAPTMASLVADRVVEALRQQTARATAEATTLLDSTLRRATTSRRDAAPRAVQIVGIAAPPAPPVIASILFPPEGVPLVVGVAQGAAGTAAQAQAEAAVKATRATLDATGREPLAIAATVGPLPAIIIVQRIASGAGSGIHALVLDAAAVARPVLDPVAAAGAGVALTTRDNRPLAAAGPPLVPGAVQPAVKPLPWGGGTLNLSLVLATPPAIEAQLQPPPPDTLRSTLFGIVTALGLLVVVTTALQRRNRSA